MGTDTSVQGLPNNNLPTRDGFFIKVIQFWLRLCDEQHTCSQKLLPDCFPTWLIDTQKQCIVSGNCDTWPYIALSYTWQDSSSSSSELDPFQLDRQTQSQLEQPGCLSDKSIADRLPKVIRDAIELTHKIKERYLWVDRLCILQGADSTNSEVLRMNEIYSGARLTLMAAAEYGLYDNRTATTYESGLPERFSPLSSYARCYSHDHFDHGCRDCYDLTVKDHYAKMCESRWATRAWTYQEHILSKRAVFFLDDRIFWECECSVWDMLGLSPHYKPDNKLTPFTAKGTSRTSDIGTRLRTTSTPDLTLYANLICPYNGRNLSHSEDGLAACLGLLQGLKLSFRGGFFYGLPLEVFNDILLWQPLRECHRRTDIVKGTAYPLPSWSWCGWQCFVDPRSLISNMSSKTPSTSPPANQSLVTWSTKTKDGMTVPVSESDRIGDALPWLIGKPRQATFHTGVILRVAPFIFTDQWIDCGGNVDGFSHSVLTDKPLNTLVPVVVLRDKQGKFCGLLRATGEVQPKQTLEVIAVSKGSASRLDIEDTFEERVFRIYQDKECGPFQPQFDENGLWSGYRSLGKHGNQALMNDEEDVFEVTTEANLEVPLNTTEGYWGTGETVEFYNVLCIRREGDVAYREACGRIAVETWERNCVGDVEVTLG